jgi:hypothetical protein
MMQSMINTQFNSSTSAFQIVNPHPIENVLNLATPQVLVKSEPE